MKRSQLINIIKEVVSDELGNVPKSDIEYVTPAEAAHLIYNTNGTMFDVTFVKKDGTDRRMNARLGVKKYLKGGSLKFDPKERGYIVVYDIQCGLRAQSEDDKACYRMININTLKSVRIKGRKYVVRSEENSIEKGVAS